MKKAKKLNVLTNSIGWALFKDEKPHQDLDGVCSIYLDDFEVTKARKIAEHVWETMKEIN